MSDKLIRKLVEKYNFVLLTRDVNFPEPRLAGDRVLVIDVPRKTALQEVLRRIRQLGW
jgi:hypothetical protein